MTQKLLVICAVILVTLFVACKSSDDAKITSDIKTKITDDQRLDAARIDVDTKNGVVTLKGKVLGKQEENRAIEIAQTTPGVAKVVSRLDVENEIGNSEIKDRVSRDQEASEKKMNEAQGQETVGEELDDASITTKVKLAFAKDPAVAGYRIDVDTKQGVVTLTGKVKNSTEANQAIADAQAVKGVKSVNSVLTVGS